MPPSDAAPVLAALARLETRLATHEAILARILAMLATGDAKLGLVQADLALVVEAASVPPGPSAVQTLLRDIRRRLPEAADEDEPSLHDKSGTRRN